MPLVIQIRPQLCKVLFIPSKVHLAKNTPFSPMQRLFEITVEKSLWNRIATISLNICPFSKIKIRFKHISLTAVLMLDWDQQLHKNIWMKVTLG